MNVPLEDELSADEERVLNCLFIPMGLEEIAKEVGMDPKRVMQCLDALRSRHMVGRERLTRPEIVHYSRATPFAFLSSMIKACEDGLPPVTTNEGRKIRLSSADLRVIACIGRAEGYISLSEISRETDVDRPSLRWRLLDLVKLGVLQETPLSGGRRQYTLAGLSMEQVEALEEIPRPPTGEHDGGRRDTSPRDHREKPTENEERVLEFLRRPATQDEIAGQFGYGRSRRSSAP